MNSRALNILLEGCHDRSEKDFEKGEEILKEGQRDDKIYVLVKGAVEVVKEGVQIAVVEQKGAVFGEISALIKTPHNATVRALSNCKCYIIPNASHYLEDNPSATLAVARMLAERLYNIDAKFAELKKRLTLI
ncbi:MAG: cyclic nucleotide-binding domain-containing protein [Verrucomicrobiae bacterium]|nr:cyclic nucleotide-binding domain-containing protein [Verrucomicrobiae bacterium]